MPVESEILWLMMSNGWVVTREFRVKGCTQPRYRFKAWPAKGNPGGKYAGHGEIFTAEARTELAALPELVGMVGLEVGEG